MSNGAARSGAAGNVRAASLALSAVLVVSLSTACSNNQSAANRQPYEGTTAAAATNGVQTITLRVDNGFRFHPSTIVVHPGTVQITLDHGPTGAPHNWQLSGLPGAYVPPVGAGAKGTVTFTAPAAGKYTFVCTIHERQGQTGTMIVLAD